MMMMADPSLANTRSASIDGYEAEQRTENGQPVHYVSIPVDASRTRSVTIQVYYNNGNGATWTTSTEDDGSRNSGSSTNESPGQNGVETSRTFPTHDDPFLSVNTTVDPMLTGQPMGMSGEDEEEPRIDVETVRWSSEIGHPDVEDEPDSFLGITSHGKDLDDGKNQLMDLFDDRDPNSNESGLHGSTDSFRDADYNNPFNMMIVESDQQHAGENRKSEQFDDYDSCPAFYYDDFDMNVEAEEGEAGVERSKSQIYTINPQPTNTSDEGAFRCTWTNCGKSFRNQRALHYHSVIHSPTIYTCSKCRKSFATMPKLRRHALIHQNIRPFVCEVPECGKSFTTRSNLRVHRRVHTGEKPFVCSVCARAFSHQSHAKSHLRNVHQTRAPDDSTIGAATILELPMER